MRIVLILAILSIQLSNFLRNSTIHFRNFLCLVTFFSSHCFVAVPGTIYNNFAPFTNYIGYIYIYIYIYYNFQSVFSPIHINTDDDIFVDWSRAGADTLEHVSLIKLVTGMTTKPWLSGNMLPNINTCENLWSNFSENRIVVEIKLLELTLFASPYLTIYFYFIQCWGLLILIKRDFSCTVHF